MKKLTSIILAGGQGTRMKSPLPKVLHPVAGVPMIVRIINQVKKAGVDEVRVVIGHGTALVQQFLQPLNVQQYIQKQQLGTADAVKAAHLEDIDGTVLIIAGDHPLIRAGEITKLLNEFEIKALDLAVISSQVQTPGKFGRIVRKDGNLQRIVEANEASPEILEIKEINTGLFFAKASLLKELIPQIENKNSKNEFYLTDIVQLAIAKKYKVDAVISQNPDIAQGVNSQSELALAGLRMFQHKAEELMENGVIIIDPRTVYIEDTVIIGAGSVIYPNNYIRGKTAIGPFCVLESNCNISDSVIEDGVQVRAGSYLEQVIVKSKAQIGPYARLRPDTVIGADAKVGNFVEMKKVNFGAGSKASHLTYLGDAEIGQNVNIGCGTITCNYAADHKKYKTIIKDNVFVGSDSQFVAPVTVHENAIIASGSTITKDVPAGALAIARGRQENKLGLAKKFKSKD